MSADTGHGLEARRTKLVERAHTEDILVLRTKKCSCHAYVRRKWLVRGQMQHLFINGYTPSGYRSKCVIEIMCYETCCQLPPPAQN